MAEPSHFFDMTYQSATRDSIHQIATETKISHAPVELRLHIREKTPSGRSIAAGNHELKFYLTYCNGQEWKSASERVTLTVPNFFKRNEGLTWTVGIITFVVTVADPIISLFR
jgi:hypothetical protein